MHADYLLLNQAIRGQERGIAGIEDDMMAQSILKFRDTGQCTIWTAFCAQVSVEVCFLLGSEKAGRGLVELRRVAQDMLNSMGQRRKFEPHPPPRSKWTAKPDYVTHFLRTTTNTPSRASITKTLMQSNPVMCGLTLSKSRLCHLQFGMGLAKCWQNTTFAGHLYFAAFRHAGAGQLP
ncbi:hypothetical protein OC842_002462 [Tilletia horrida]|uniref:Uncharacterized protein n=1 Tax=Tilletia horrida TaxID=155126 RepID=A0AAN6GFW3_9BASI|nr:hypothetical protein OC842_002462 [Tilletia horrida]